MNNYLKYLVPAKVRRRIRYNQRMRAILASSHNHTLAKLYFPAKEIDSDGWLVKSRIPQQSDAIGVDGAPLPPADITMAYLKDPETYINRGKEWANKLKELAHQYGSLSPGDAILDWGCSSGRVIRHFRSEAESKELECWGVDLEVRAVEWARYNLPPIQFATCSTIPHLPFEDHKFALIYGLSVMTHVQHFEDTWLLELKRVLKPGGVLVLTIHDEDTIEWFGKNGREYWIPEEVECDELMRDADRTVLRGVDPIDTFTFFSKKYINRVWGSFLSVREIIALWAPGSKQSAVVMTRKALDHTTG